MFVANTNANGENYIMDPVTEHVNKRIVEHKEYRELNDFERRDSRYQFGPTKRRRNTTDRVNAV